MSPVWAIVRNEVRMLSREVEAIVLLVLMPLVLTAVLRDTITESLAATSERPVDGAQYTVPGQAVLFGFFVVSLVALTFFREHGWHTWDRLLASPARPWQIVLGKVLPWIVVTLVQTATLVLAGWVLLDLEVSAGDLVGIGIVTFGYALFLVSFAVLLVSITSSMLQVDAVGNLGAMVLGAIGGALVPAALLPGWAEALGPLTPTYWVMQGHTDVLVEDQRWTAVLGPTAIVVGYGVAALALAAWRFDPDQHKQGIG